MSRAHSAPPGADRQCKPKLQGLSPSHLHMTQIPWGCRTQGGVCAARSWARSGDAEWMGVQQKQIKAETTRKKEELLPQILNDETVSEPSACQAWRVG